jgi:ABC-type transport system involved in multi-copper enzyme maturation permease subunit
VGPLFYYELVRLARKGRSTLLRCAYALAVLLALFLAYRARIPHHDLWASPFAPPEVPAGELTSLAQGFVQVILWAQTAAVFVLTPVYLAGAVLEQKECGTLELLLTTRLSSREIVVGMLAGRMAHLGGVLLAGLPLLALAQLWGGFEVRSVAAAFALTGLQMLSVGVLSIFLSLRERSDWDATIASYLAGAGLFFGSLPFPGATPASLFLTLNRPGGPTAEDAVLVSLCVAGHAAVALVFGVAAVGLLRPRAISPPEPGPGVLAREVRAPNPGGPKRPPPAPRTAPPVGDHPLLWKETFREAGDGNTREFEDLWRQRPVRAFGLPAGVVAFLWLATFTRGAEQWLLASGFLLRMSGFFFAVVWCAKTAFRAAGSVSLERDRRTLDGLLTLPVGRGVVLGAKWLGPILEGRSFGYGLCVAGAIGAGAGNFHPLAVAAVAVLVAVQVGFWAAAGLWLSVACRSTVRARVAAVLALLAVGGGLAYQTVEGVRSRDRLEQARLRNSAGASGPSTPAEDLPFAIADVGVNPFRAGWLLSFGWRGVEAPDYFEARLLGVRLAAAASGALAFALAGGLLWLDACRRFRKA